ENGTLRSVGVLSMGDLGRSTMDLREMMLTARSTLRQEKSMKSRKRKKSSSQLRMALRVHGRIHLHNDQVARSKIGQSTGAYQFPTAQKRADIEPADCVAPGEVHVCPRKVGPHVAGGNDRLGERRQMHVHCLFLLF